MKFEYLLFLFVLASDDSDGDSGICVCLMLGFVVWHRNVCVRLNSRPKAFFPVHGEGIFHRVLLE